MNEDFSIKRKLTAPSAYCSKAALLWVESFLGGGHIEVAANLANALIAQGYHVAILTSCIEKVQQCGLDKVENIQIVKLPGLSKKHGAKVFTTPSGKVPEEDIEWQKERARIIAQTYDALKPQVLITEMWPIERRFFNFELLPLVEAAKCPTICLLRDVLYVPDTDVRSKDCTEDMAANIALKHLDKIIVRGDKNILTLDEKNFLPIAQIEHLLDYAGYIVADTPPQKCMREKSREVIVSSGAEFTDDSLALYRAAMQVKEHSDLSDRVWRLFISPQCPEDIFQGLKDEARQIGDDGIVVERNNSSFQQRVSGAALHISQGGYNSVMQTIYAGVPLIIVPVTDPHGQERSEQSVRGKHFDKIGLLKMVTLEDAQAIGKFAQAIEEVLMLGQPDNRVNMDGARLAANTIDEMVSEKMRKRCMLLHIRRYPHTKENG